MQTVNVDPQILRFAKNRMSHLFTESTDTLDSIISALDSGTINLKAFPIPVCVAIPSPGLLPPSYPYFGPPWELFCMSDICHSVTYAAKVLRCRASAALQADRTGADGDNLMKVRVYPFGHPRIMRMTVEGPEWYRCFTSRNLGHSPLVHSQWRNLMFTAEWGWKFPQSSMLQPEMRELLPFLFFRHQQLRLPLPSIIIIPRIQRGACGEQNQMLMGAQGNQEDTMVRGNQDDTSADNQKKENSESNRDDECLLRMMDITAAVLDALDMDKEEQDKKYRIPGLQSMGCAWGICWHPLLSVAPPPGLNELPDLD